MRRHRPPGFHGNNLPGPGDFTPPDEEELPDHYLDEAWEQLRNEQDSESGVPTDEMATTRAWELYEAAKKQAEYDAGEDAYERQQDREAGLE